MRTGTDGREESDPVEVGEEGARRGPRGSARRGTNGAGPEADTAAESDGFRGGHGRGTGSPRVRHPGTLSPDFGLLITIPVPPPAGVSSTDRQHGPSPGRSNTCIRTTH